MFLYKVLFSAGTPKLAEHLQLEHLSSFNGYPFITKVSELVFTEIIIPTQQIELSCVPLCALPTPFLEEGKHLLGQKIISNHQLLQYVHQNLPFFPLREGHRNFQFLGHANYDLYNVFNSFFLQAYNYKYKFKYPYSSISNIVSWKLMFFHISNKTSGVGSNSLNMYIWWLECQLSSCFPSKTTYWLLVQRIKDFIPGTHMEVHNLLQLQSLFCLWVHQTCLWCTNIPMGKTPKHHKIMMKINVEYKAVYA